MFDGKYFEWNQKRIKAIIDYYGYKFFYEKKVADLGCGYADISGSLYRLGAAVTAVDARQEHLKIVTKKYSGIKTIKANLDGQWPFYGQKFDLILDLGLICHLSSFEDHLKTICASTTHLVLETAVCDSDDPNSCPQVPEGKNIYDLSFNGVGCRPSAAAIERVLTACGMEFKRMDNAKFNVGEYVYDWQPNNDGSTNINKRRIWFAVRNGELPNQLPLPNQPLTALQPGNLTSGTAQLIQSNGVPLTLTASPKAPKMHGGTKPWDPAAIAANQQLPQEPVALPNVIPSSSIQQTNSAPFTGTNKRFVIVIPSYKNSAWCEKNIASALSQNYKDYRIIFTDDCSPDDTFTKVSAIVNASTKSSQVTLIKNSTRRGALANLYDMIHSCDDDEIILTLDGDDWFPNGEVLNRLNSIYSSQDIWMTYGQYQNSNDGGRGVAHAYPQNIINNNNFRNHSWGASHLRTFYAWLFKRINKNHLMYQGEFFSMTWDFAMMFPMLEMSGPRSQYVNDILYVYNLDNPINDHKVNVTLQRKLDKHIREMPKYHKVERPPKTTVGLMMIATGKYDKFIQGLISSADSYFLNNYDVTYYIFSDKSPSIKSRRNVVHIPITHKPFPFASMDRFKHFIQNADKLTTSFLYYIDVDSLFVDRVDKEIFGNLVGVQHCGYYLKQGPVENNPQSCLYIPDTNRYKNYFGGGFSGGRHSSYLSLAKWCSDHIEQDVANGIIPIWHDETAINRYFLDHEPDIILNPSYHYPQSNTDYYKKKWGRDFHPRIMLLDKNHGEIRK